MKPIGHWIEEREMSFEGLVESSGLDAKLVRAIATGNYTPSPSQRAALAMALGVEVGDVAWGHAVPVQHLRGNGPQFGRST
jgi:ribosome-binding protein aMBF1 (putative translation factor)